MINPSDLREVIHEPADANWPELAAKASAAKVSYLAATRSEPDWIFGERELSTSQDVNVLTGLPGSTGCAEGEVFVLDSTDDFKHFPKGAILVARTTSPAWTPLFYSAAAIITASGGPLSHGAVTAREVGIPAVMSVRSALTKLTNGLRVRVDGTLGDVALLGGAS